MLFKSVFATTLLAGALSGIMVWSQATNSGDIRGTVTDTTGAAIPGVSVTVLNLNTGVTKAYTTDDAGLYDTSSIVNGSYTISFRKIGFKEFVRGPVTVLVGFTTVNAQLGIGSATESVVVTSDVPLLQTESGAQETTLTAETLQQLPQVGQDWQPFTILLPGATGNNSTPVASNPGQDAAINGNLPYPLILSDGASTTAPQSVNASTNILETVAELQVSTSNFSAQYGQGGVIYNQISKGGTDKFHGTIYEYLQNDALNAANYGFGNSVPVPFLRYNNYGGSVGGPILKKKMFFFFDYDKMDNEGNSTGFTTLPTNAMLSGDFTGQSTIYDPTTQVVTQTPDGPVVTRTSFAQEYGQGNKIPAALIDPVAKAIAAFYPTPSNHPSNGFFVPGTMVDGVDTSNYYFGNRNKSPQARFFGRLDYDITPTNRLTVSNTESDTAGNSPYIYQCPVDCQLFDWGGNTAQISDVWNINSSTINEARLGFTNAYSLFTPASLNKGYPQQLGLLFAKANLFPQVGIYGNNCCDAPGPQTNANYTQYTYDPSDVITLIRGKHVLHFGAEFLDQWRNGTGWGNINAATVQYTGAYTQSTVGDGTSGIAFADFLLGYTQSWNAAVTPSFGGRIKVPQGFVQDDIKLKPNLTVNVGLRYQGETGIGEVHNNATVFDPAVHNPATGTNGGIWYGETAANGRRKLIAPVWDTFLPRFGASWLMEPKTTIRGGVGLYAYPYNMDQNGWGLGNALAALGAVTDQTNGIDPVVVLSSSGSQLPYGTSNFDPSALAGQDLSYVAYHTPIAKSLQWNLQVEHELKTNTVAKLAYVGNHSLNLNFPTDLNQVPASKLGPNDNPSGRPYPYYGSIYGSVNNGISNYNSMQASITRRFAGGLSYDFNYTWSKFLDTQDSGGYGYGVQAFQIADPAANYGPSEFDTRHAFKGMAAYLLPVGVGRRFLNHNRALDAAIGGWQVAGTVMLSSGNPFTPVINGPNNSFSQAGYWYPNVIGNPKLSHRTVQQWFDPAAFTSPADGTFGNMQRNSVYGPGMEEINLSAGKAFRVENRFSLLIRGDAVNALNHPSFGIPDYGLNCTTPGAPCTGAANITSTSVGGRTMQLGARLSF